MSWFPWVLTGAGALTNLVLGLLVWYLRKMNGLQARTLEALARSDSEKSLMVQAANERMRRAEAALAVKLRLEALDDRAQLDHIDRMPASARARAVADLLNKLHPGGPSDGPGPAEVPAPGPGDVPKPDGGGVR